MWVYLANCFTIDIVLLHAMSCYVLLLSMSFLALWLVEQFDRHICRQAIDWIELKYGWWTNHRARKAWLTGLAPVNFCCFLTSDWSNSFHAFGYLLLIWLTSNLADELIMGLPRPNGLYQDWLTFGNTLLIRTALRPYWGMCLHWYLVLYRIIYK